MISSGAYNYINILEKTADASWLRHSVISNNIANADTPTYKRKDVNFQSYLEDQLSGENSWGSWPLPQHRISYGDKTFTFVISPIN